MGTSDVKVMSLRRDGECGCGALVPQGTRAGWDRALRVVVCSDCLGQQEGPVEVGPTEVGAPGESLQRKYDRLMTARDERVRARFPRIGGVLLRMFPAARTTQAWAIGAAGEREVAERLQSKLGEQVLFLFNRRRGTGRERGDIDIIAIAPSGVWIIDPKKYVGKKVRSNRGGDIFIVDGRRRPHLTESMRRQYELVSEGVRSGPVPTAPVQAAYCFVGADLPWSTLVVDGVAALGQRRVVKRLRQPGPFDDETRHRLHADLSRRFPPA
jgi:hypothetical protein